MMRLNIKKNPKFALVGHGYHLNFFFDELIKNRLPKPIIITHQKKLHLRDIKNSKNDQSLYRSVFELENKTKVFYIDDINSKKSISILKKNKIDYIFSLSSRFIFKSEIVNNYKNKIFNIHPTILPEERGGGIFTYRILNKKKFCAATIHVIDEGIDTGKVLLRSKKEKLKGQALPVNYLKHTNLIYKSLLKVFIKKIINNNSFILKNQNLTKGWYLPRFYTDNSGAINWLWTGENIDLFIKACSEPYPGAFCFIKYKNKDLKITIYNCDYERKSKFTHPFFTGKIFYENKDIFKISVMSGIITVKKKDIRLEKNIVLKKFIGKTLYNFSNELTKSLSDITSVFSFK
jgi:methionyl-tRNA formyltransferase